MSSNADASVVPDVSSNADVFMAVYALARDAPANCAV
jgi:hypothetical protein